MKSVNETKVDNEKKKTRYYIILFVLGLIVGHITFPFVEHILKTFINL